MRSSCRVTQISPVWWPPWQVLGMLKSFLQGVLCPPKNEIIGNVVSPKTVHSINEVCVWHFISFLLNSVRLYVCMCACVWMCAYEYKGPPRPERHRIPWVWSYRRLWTAWLDARNPTVFSARAVYAFNCWPSLQPPEGGFLFPLKLPLKVKGKILNVFSQTLKSAHDTPIPATDILWFNSRSCCSRLPYTPQFISLYSGLGFAAGSPVPPSSSASLQGWAVCPTILLTQSSNPWGVISVVSFVQPSASEPQKFP